MPNNNPLALQASDNAFTTSPLPFSHLLSRTVCFEYLLGHKQKPSWCLAVRIMPLAPDCLAMEAHWLQSRAVGLKASAGSSPCPHSLSVKVLGPKWMNQ